MTNITPEQANELQDILRTLTPSGTALITSARSLRDSYAMLQRNVSSDAAWRFAYRERICGLLGLAIPPPVTEGKFYDAIIARFDELEADAVDEFPPSTPRGA